MSAKEVSLWIRKYHFLGYIQTDVPDGVKLSSWIFSFEEMIFLQVLAFVSYPRSGPAIPWSRTGSLKLQTNEMCDKGCIGCSWDMQDVSTGVWKLVFRTLSSGAVMKHKLGASPWPSVKPQAQASFCLPVASACHWITNLLPKSLLFSCNFFFFSVFICAIVVPFVFWMGKIHFWPLAKFALIENSFMWRKCA